MAKMTAHSIEYSQWVLAVCVSYTYLCARLYANNCHLGTARECYNNYFVQHFNQTIVPWQAVTNICRANRAYTSHKADEDDSVRCIGRRHREKQPNTLRRSMKPFSNELEQYLNANMQWRGVLEGLYLNKNFNIACFKIKIYYFL